MTFYCIYENAISCVVVAPLPFLQQDIFGPIVQEDHNQRAPDWCHLETGSVALYEYGRHSSTSDENTYANSVDPDETAHKKPYHQRSTFLAILLFFFIDFFLLAPRL